MNSCSELNENELNAILNVINSNKSLHETINAQRIEIEKLKKELEKEKEISTRQFVHLVELNSKVHVMDIEITSLRKRINTTVVESSTIKNNCQQKTIELLKKRLDQTIKTESELSIERTILSQINTMKYVINQQNENNVINTLINNTFYYIKESNFYINKLPYSKSLTKNQLLSTVKDLEKTNLNVLESIKSMANTFSSIIYILSANNILKIYSLITNNNTIIPVINDTDKLKKKLTKLKLQYSILFTALITKLSNLQYSLNQYETKIEPIDYVNLLEFELIIKNIKQPDLN